jgi:hypothetical protein
VRQARGMKDAWCLAVGGGAHTGATAVKLYARRFTIEESFRPSGAVVTSHPLASERDSFAFLASNVTHVY